MTTLRDEIRKFQEGRTVPPEVEAAIRGGIDEVAASGAAGGIAVGERAPDFALPNQRGETVRLSGRLAKGPVVLSFYRGSW